MALREAPLSGTACERLVGHLYYAESEDGRLRLRRSRIPSCGCETATASFTSTAMASRDEGRPSKCPSLNFSRQNASLWSSDSWLSKESQRLERQRI